MSVALRRTDGLRAPVRIADGVFDIFLRDIRIRYAWRAYGVGINFRGPNAQSSGGILLRAWRGLPRDPVDDKNQKDNQENGKPGVGARHRDQFIPSYVFVAPAEVRDRLRTAILGRLNQYLAH